MEQASSARNMNSIMIWWYTDKEKHVLVVSYCTIQFKRSKGKDSLYCRSHYLTFVMSLEHISCNVLIPEEIVDVVCREIDRHSNSNCFFSNLLLNQVVPCINATVNKAILSHNPELHINPNKINNQF